MLERIEVVLTRLPLIRTALPASQTGEPPHTSHGHLSAQDTVLAYHERTKHHYHRFAASLGYMD